MNLSQAIETANGATWKTEMREGVKHFVTGQHRYFAVDDPEDGATSDSGVPIAGVLAYAPVLGHSIALLLIWHDGGELAHTGYAFHIRCLAPGAYELPEDFKLTEKMIATVEDEEASS